MLEDFHYLSTETQKDFSVALKAFHEESKLCFIIVGVWLEDNRLTVYNGDLTGRVFSIDADHWTNKELLEVISRGENLLNFKFSQEFVNELLLNCFSSVYIVQETCFKCCEKYNILEKQETPRNGHAVLTIGTKDDADALVDDVVSQQTGRFNSFITQFADGFQTTTLEMYKWLLYPVLTAKIDDLKLGLKLHAIRKCLEANHPQKNMLNSGNITQALKSGASLQVSKELKPLILDYDQTNLRLRVVDSSFLIWLNKQDRNSLLDLAGLPIVNVP